MGAGTVVGLYHATLPCRAVSFVSEGVVPVLIGRLFVQPRPDCALSLEV